MQRSWKQCAQAAFTLIRPTCECGRSQAAPSANHPEINLHGTRESKSNLCCRRWTHLSLQRRRGSGGGWEGRASDATALHRHVGLGRQIKVPPVVLPLLRDVLSHRVPLCLHLSSLSSLTPLPHKMLERRRGEAGEEGE